MPLYNIRFVNVIAHIITTFNIFFSIKIFLINVKKLNKNENVPLCLDLTL